MPILISNSSLPSIARQDYTSALIFPKGLEVPYIGHTRENHEAFVSQFLSSNRLFRQKLHRLILAQRSRDRQIRTGIPMTEEDRMILQKKLYYTKVTSPTILICGHNSRDTRCGILGPILFDEFNSHLHGDRRSKLVGEDSVGFKFDNFEPLSKSSKSRVALISHIGGHAFAGNVIINLPRPFITSSGGSSPLAGASIWYGRVEPRHVQGIVEETIKKGNIIEELLRGIHDPDVREESTEAP